MVRSITVIEAGASDSFCGMRVAEVTSGISTKKSLSLSRIVSLARALPLKANRAVTSGRNRCDWCMNRLARFEGVT
jgi:hypothetical protein